MPRHAPVEERFWAKVEKTNDCWVWTGAKKQPPGLPYGFIVINGGNRQTHRVSWEMHHGPIPEGMNVCHQCDNASCVNPAHLYLGDQGQNLRDASRRRRIASGSRHGMAKLTEDNVREIRRRHKTDGPKALGEEFGVHPIHICGIVARRSWRNI